MMWYVNPISLFLIITSLLILGGFLFVWGKRVSIVGAPPALIVLGNVLWMFAYGVALGVQGLQARLFWASIQYPAIALSVIGLTAFALSISGYVRWLSRRNVVLFCLVPALGSLLAFTNEFHHLVWVDERQFFVSGLSLLRLRYGPFFWINTIYNYLALVFSLLLLARASRALKGTQRGQAAFTLLIGALVPILANFLYIFSLNPLDSLYLTLAGYSITVALIGWGLWRYRLLEIVKIPRDKVIQDMPDALVVMDMAGRVVDLNPAALKLFNLSESEVLGLSLQRLEADKKINIEDTGLLRRFQDIYYEVQQEITLGAPFPDPGRYDFRLSPIYDWSGRMTGRLIVLRNITEMHRRELALLDANTRLEQLTNRLMNEMSMRQNLEIQTLEQQRVLAVLDERERLGRDLHDGLGQTLGALNLDAQSAQALLEQGDLATLGSHLAKIARVARHGHDSVRAFITSLRPARQKLDLPGALKILLDQFNLRGGAQASLEYPENAPAPAFQPNVEEAALHLVREALSNAHKHARAQRVTVRFSFHADQALIEIEDDGTGFTPTDLSQPDQAHASPGETHFGLAMMREGIEKAGGRFDLFSATGRGTRLRAQLPCLDPRSPEEMDADDLSTARGLRILLADDHPLFLEGLRNLLQLRGLTVVGMARDGLEAQKLALELRPDVVVMDVNMPGVDGLAATRTIKFARPEIKVLILTVSEEEDSLYEAIKNGASGYLLKNLEADEFIHMLAGFSRGETPLAAGIALRVMKKLDRRIAQRPAGVTPARNLAERPAGLSGRQWAILQGVAQGQRYKEIAAQLGLSERTVKREMGLVLDVLHFESRREMVDFAREVLNPPPE